MARIKFTRACVLFLVLMIFSEVLLSEGRHLKQQKKREECRKCLMHGMKDSLNETTKGDGQELSGGVQHYHTSTVIDVDNFQPTSPGHSPGIGHSKVDHYNTSTVMDVDNFRPSGPGHNPGIGHSQVEHSNASTVIDVDDFRPTEPGHSPGIGHSLRN
ncbi:hypothetical protein MRB53_033637 [Persea americana]|uniref:Uncharacterized protein n=1 Tax=Persea americana TaxID=3435 RepID=A0ACC2KV79_PERAE|nr:hypothetical protein MRB53_033637 [Persea americana]